MFVCFSLTLIIYIMHKLKSLLRDALPIRYQVPIKYFYALFLGAKEPEMDLLEYLISDDGRAIDVGANRGIYSYIISKYKCKLEIFEPNPDCLKLLEAWSSNFSNISIHPFGLSSHEGQANLHIPIDENGMEHDASASLQKNLFANSRNQKINIKNLDGFNFDKISFIKIDVEGHEIDVINGGLKTIQANMPALLIEIEQRHNSQNIDSIFQMILELGYKGFFIKNNKLNRIETFNLQEDQSSENFGDLNLYRNNFLFLCQDKIDNGTYKTLFDQRLCRDL